MKFFPCTDASNNLLTGVLADLSSSSNVKLNCTFLSGFNGSAHCTVQYGTDLNVPYSAESTETGTAGDTVSVVLSERLNSSTVYYYTVSAVSGDIMVTVQGNFTTLQYSKYLYVLGLKPSQSIAMINSIFLVITICRSRHACAYELIILWLPLTYMGMFRVTVFHAYRMANCSLPLYIVAHKN